MLLPDLRTKYLRGYLCLELSKKSVFSLRLVEVHAFENICLKGYAGISKKNNGVTDIKCIPPTYKFHMSDIEILT